MEGKTDNELIAEFMGVHVTHSMGVLWVVDEEGDMPDYKNGRVYYPSNDWNQLMPVVQKIDGMGYHVTIMRTRTIIAITLNVQNHIQSIHPGYSMIEVCYQAVVEFIKWYNRQKEK